MEIDQPLRAVIVAMMLLENADSDEIHPDLAVRGLENIGFELTRDHRQREALLAAFDRIAATSDDIAIADFARRMPEILDLRPSIPESVDGW